MNGEIFQMFDIVVGARKALCNNDTIKLNLSGYILKLKFIFIKRDILNINEVFSAEDWFDTCRKCHLQDIKLIVPTNVPDRMILGFANTSRSSIICFWENNTVSYFTANWKFNKDDNGWEVTYEEQPWNDPPAGKPVFEERKNEFKQVLLNIEDLAYKIEADSFARIFRKAYDILNGNNTVSENPKIAIPDIPEPYRSNFMAALTADVFGAMMSWNDSPPGYAHEKGLEKEYNELSDKLLFEIRYSLMFAANECWKA